MIKKWCCLAATTFAFVEEKKEEKEKETI